MLIKPFIKPVFAKLIEHDESFACAIINKSLAGNFIIYENLSLIYKKNQLQKEEKEKQAAKVEFDISIIYKLLMEFLTIKNVPKALSNNYVFHINSIKNNINNYLKAISHIDKSLYSKLRIINNSINENNYNNYKAYPIISDNKFYFKNTIFSEDILKEQNWSLKKEYLEKNIYKVNYNIKPLNFKVLKENLTQHSKNISEVVYKNNVENIDKTSVIKRDFLFNIHHKALNKKYQVSKGNNVSINQLLRSINVSSNHTFKDLTVKNLYLNSLKNLFNKNIIDFDNKLNLNNYNFALYKNGYNNKVYENAYSLRSINSLKYKNIVFQGKRNINSSSFLNHYENKLFYLRLMDQFNSNNSNYIKQLLVLINMTNSSSLEKLNRNRVSLNILKHLFQINTKVKNDNKSSMFQKLTEKLEIENRNINDLVNIYKDKSYKNITSNLKSEKISNYKNIKSPNRSKTRNISFTNYYEDNIENINKSSVIERNFLSNIHHKILNKNSQILSYAVFNTSRTLDISRFENQILLKKITYPEFMDQVNKGNNISINQLVSSINVSSDNTFKDLTVNNLHSKNIKNLSNKNIGDYANKLNLNNYKLALYKNYVFSKHMFMKKSVVLTQVFQEVNKFNEALAFNYKWLFENKLKDTLYNNSISLNVSQERLLNKNLKLKRYAFTSKMYESDYNNKVYKNADSLISINSLKYTKSMFQGEDSIENSSLSNYYENNQIYLGLVNKFNSKNSDYKLHNNIIYSLRLNEMQNHKALINNKLQEKLTIKSSDLKIYTFKSINLINEDDKKSAWGVNKFTLDYINHSKKKAEGVTKFISDYVTHNKKKAVKSNGEIYDERYKNKVNMLHKKVQAVVPKENSEIEEIEKENNIKYVTEEKLKFVVNEVVERTIDNKFKKEKIIEKIEEKEIESISNKVLAKIDRELKYEKRRRGLI